MLSDILFGTGTDGLEDGSILIVGWAVMGATIPVFCTGGS